MRISFSCFQNMFLLANLKFNLKNLNVQVKSNFCLSLRRLSLWVHKREIITQRPVKNWLSSSLHQTSIFSTHNASTKIHLCTLQQMSSKIEVPQRLRVWNVQALLYQQNSWTSTQERRKSHRWNLYSGSTWNNANLKHDGDDQEKLQYLQIQVLLLA